MSLLTTLLAVTTLLLLGFVFFLSGGGGPAVSHYKSQTPLLDIREYFNGKLIAYGVIHSRGGEVIDRFTAEITGAWDGNNGTLDEVFTYSDGQVETRKWMLTMSEDGTHFTGTASDVVGEATGTQHGNTLNMLYTLRRTVNGREMTFKLDDWMYLVDDKYLVNRATMRKFGVKVAELVVGFHKVEK